MQGTSVRVVCENKKCGTPFTYLKRSNVTRRFCTACANARIQASKKKSLQQQREDRHQERRAKAVLDRIPDYEVNPLRALERVSRTIM